MRRRAEKQTVPIPHETLAQLASSWHAQLNDSAYAQCPTTEVNGRRDDGRNLSTATQGE